MRALILCLSSFAIMTSSLSAKPNVLFILCDDLRPDALGC
jgi:hypothetical protein